MTHQHCWVTTDPTGGDPWMGGPVTIVVCADCGREQMDRPNAYEQGQRDAIAVAVHRVEALQDFWRDPYYGTDHLVLGQFNDALAQAIAAIKGEQPIEDKITFIRGNDRLEQLRKNNS